MQTTLKMLAKEFQAVHGHRPRSKALAGAVRSPSDRLRAACLEKDQAAICLSGGGIRSAAFALGVLQALAERKLLDRFHYLSTVSGGGYTGAWLQNWIFRKDGDVGAVQSQLAARGVDPAEIGWLRQYSNFLTPQTGLASIDTWTGMVLFVRNLLLNWLIIVPMFLVIACVVRVYADPVYMGPVDSIPGGAWNPLLVWGVVSLFLFAAVTATCILLPSHRRATQAAAPVAAAGSRSIMLLAILPALVWVFAVPLIVAAGHVDPDDAPWWIAGSGFVSYVLAYLLGWIISRRIPGWDASRLFGRNIGWWLAAAAVSAGLAGGGYALLQHATGRAEWNLAPVWQNILVLLLGPLILSLSHLVLTALYSAFRFTGDVPSDTDREWLARLSATELRVTVGLCLLLLLVVALPELLAEPPPLKEWKEEIVAAVAMVSGLFSAVSGKSAKTGEGPADMPSATPLDKAAGVAAVVFICAIFVLASQATGAAAAGIASFGQEWGWTGRKGIVLVGIPALAIGLLASWRIKSNNFSMHGTYRNRLIRCFLGAASHPRADDPFTGFANSDNPKLAALRLPYQAKPGRAVKPWRLFPVVNTTLNLVRSTNLAWQERKAASFTFTPLACGSAILSKPPTGGVPPGCFVDPHHYAGIEEESGFKGVSLGTAMAISGAAASPSMGYHTSAATAFLLTMFNVRLGAWLPNPAASTELDRSGPRWALKPLVFEMLGLTDAAGKDIYLSDGGHFENLGLYEMVRRGCRYIVISDAGADGSLGFEDLGNAIRKIRIDFGIRIEMGPMVWIKGAAQTRYADGYAFGDIHYASDQIGKLIYLKPSLLEDGVPMDVEAYHRANRGFPHQSTADQFFSESQFEAYRNLGFFLMKDAVAKLGKTGTSFPPLGITAPPAQPAAAPQLPPGTFKIEGDFDAVVRLR